MVVHRHELRATLAKLCRLLTKAPAGPTVADDRCHVARGQRRARHAGHGAFAGAGERLNAASAPSIPSSRGCCGLHPKRIDLSLDRMWRMLDALGHPERQLPPVIHVAGTNGKGSTIAFMRAMLEAAGLRVHVYTSPHLVRFNERFRLGARRRRRAGHRRGAGGRALTECEAANGAAPITVFEIETAAALSVVRAPSRRRAAARSRARRPARRHQRDRAAAGERDHAGVARSRRIPRRHARRDRGREGRHPQARRAGDRGGAAARRARRDRTPGGAAVGADPDRRRGLDRDRGARPPRLSGRCRPARSAGAEALRPPSVRERRPRDRDAARDRTASSSRPRPSRRASPRPTGRRACSGCRRAACRAWRRPAASCGSTAATMPTAAAPSPMRSPTSRSACSRPLVLVVGMLSTKDCRRSCGTSPVWRAASSRCRSRIRRRRLPAADHRRGRARGRHSGASEPTASKRRSPQVARARPRPAAAHPDHRLALSRRRGPGRQRHAAAVRTRHQHGNFSRSAFFALTRSTVHRHDDSWRASHGMPRVMQRRPFDRLLEQSSGSEERFRPRR